MVQRNLLRKNSKADESFDGETHYNGGALAPGNKE
jgi:hypothetical protein